MGDGGSLVVELAAVAPSPSRVHHPGLGTTRTGPAGKGWAVLTVTDNGVGMSDEVRARCTDPFFTTKGPGQGTGLGLPTVLALVNAGGGHLEVDTTPGEGTVVTVRLPISDELAPAEEPETAATLPGPTRLSGRALLVEDDEELNALAARALRGAGLWVTCVISGEAATRAVREDGPFDVLVTDVMLPGQSGIELVKALPADGGTLPVLFVTSYHGTAEPLVDLDGHVQVLRKPYRLEDLVLAVADLLGVRSAQG